MVKKRIVMFSLALLFSGMVRATDDSKDQSDGSNKLPSASALSPLSRAPESMEEKLRELCSTQENRAAAAKIALYLEMGDITEKVSGELAQAQLFGASESKAVKDAIARYGDHEDRTNAVDKMVVGLEKQANNILGQLVLLTGQERIALEKNLATLTGIKNALIDAKDEIVNGGGSKSEEGLFAGYVDVSNNLYHRRAVEVLAGAGVTAIVGVVGWVGKKLIRG